MGQSEAKEEHIKQITLEGEETTVLIKAQDPNDPTRTKEYSVIIKYKSDNADLEIIQVDGKDAIKQMKDIIQQQQWKQQQAKSM